MPRLPLQPDDHFALVHALEPQLSPDGRQIAYLQYRADVATDTYGSTLWIVDAASATQRCLGAGAAPRWSPGGDRLAFLRHDGRAQQLFVWDAASGTTARLTDATESCSGPAWSPDGTRIAFVRLVRAVPPPPLPPNPLRTGAWAPAGVYTERLVRRVEGLADDLAEGRHHVFVITLDSGASRQLTDGPHDHGGPLAQTVKVTRLGRLSWTPDGRGLVMSLNRDPVAPGAPDPGRALACDVYEYDVGSGAATRLTQFDGAASNAAVSPDGRWIAFAGFRNTRKAFHTQALHLLDRRSGALRALPHPRGLEVHAQFEWMPDSDGLLALVHERGDGCLVRVGLDGAWTTLHRDVGGSLGSGYTMWSRSVSVSRAGELAFLQARTDGPDEVALCTIAGGPARRVTANNETLLAQRAIAPTDELRFDSPLDGTRLQAWITRPPDFDPARSYPLVLWIHGGPYLAWGPQFALTPQWLAARGYLVLLLNPRGSLGYGEPFIDAIEHCFPSVEDLEFGAAVDAAIALGSVDERRLFIAGESGGGTLTSWIIGRTARFAAAAIAYPAIDWTSLALTVDRPDYYPHYWFPAPPWEAGMHEHYWQRSPLSLVGQVTTPALLLCGEHDRRTPLAQSEMYFTALKLRGVEAALVVFPDDGHSLDGHPSHGLELIAHMDRWFRRHTAGA